MNQVSYKAIIREMDAEELETEASRLVSKKNKEGLTGDEQEALWAIPIHYKTITGHELVVDTKPQLVS